MSSRYSFIPVKSYRSFLEWLRFYGVRPSWWTEREWLRVQSKINEPLSPISLDERSKLFLEVLLGKGIKDGKVPAAQSW